MKTNVAIGILTLLLLISLWLLIYQWRADVLFRAGVQAASLQQASNLLVASMLAQVEKTGEVVIRNGNKQVVLVRKEAQNE